MSKANTYVPTEEEFKELGFKKHGGMVLETSEMRYVGFGDGFCVVKDQFEQVVVYPKSLEELRTLIAMMKP